LDILIVM